MSNYFVVVFVYYVLVYLCGYLFYIVICLRPSCVVCYFLDVDQKRGEVLRMCSGLIVVGYYKMIVLDIERQVFRKIKTKKVLMMFDLKKVFREVKVFLVILIMLYQMKHQLGRLLNLVHLECRCVLSNRGDVL